MRILRYQPDYKAEWDAFVSASKNATFLHYRDYMEYHAHLFTDHSLVILDEKEQVMALLPADILNDHLRSHGGLTYGGLLMSSRIKAAQVSEIFVLLEMYFQTAGIKKVTYKPSPYFYHNQPAEEDLYALTQMGYDLVRRDVSSVFQYQHSSENPKKIRGRRRGASVGFKLQITQTSESILKIVNSTLKTKYGVESVHTCMEMDLLRSRFPRSIVFHEMIFEGEVVGGAIIFLNRLTAHIQYLAVSADVQSKRGLDYLLGSLLEIYATEYEWMDYGISTEDEGRILNTGLINAKEEFNFRAVCYDTYAKSIGNQS